MTAPANVVVAAGQNGPMMRQRGIVAHQAHRVGIGFGAVVVGVLHGDGGGGLGLVGLGGVLGGIFGFGVVPDYRGAGAAASAATATTNTAAAASISASATAGHCLYCIYVLTCRVVGQLVLSTSRSSHALLAARFWLRAASFLPAALFASFPVSLSASPSYSLK